MNTYLILHHQSFELILPNRHLTYSFEKEETGADFQLLERSSLLQAMSETLAQLPFPKNSPIYLLIDHPWVEVVNFELSYIPSKKATRSILSHALTNIFLEDQDQYHFEFFEQKTAKGAKFFIYAAQKALSEKLAQVFNQLRLPLAGLYALPHWQIVACLNRPEGDGWYLLKNLWLGRILKVESGACLEYLKVDFAAGESEEEKNLKLSRRFEFNALYGKEDLPVHRLDTPLSQPAALESEAFSYLDGLQKELQKKRLLLNIFSVQNAWLKEVLQFRQEYRKLGLAFAASFGLLFVAFLIQAWYGRDENSYLQQIAQAELTRANLQDKTFGEAYNQTHLSLRKEEAQWLRHEPFASKRFTLSEYLLGLYALVKKTPSVQITGLVWDKKEQILSGSASNGEELTNFLTLFQNYSQAKELNTERSEVNARIIFQTRAVF